ncbi:MAG: hypothetical protein F4Z74_05235 [Acidobacteria bacterium]|nr:hypothetical protein [Acidobacteriota bacterium]MYE43782.1 hypothetical protein [Acidobacteriota bacterium]
MRIQPGRRKPGVPLPSAPTADPGSRSAASVTGRALIFWDPKRPGGKRDAIDTDQITPSADCVSESLDALDARWKAGAFRHLMPDFAARVRAGQNFVIAGERFGIGSSREMSPAGLLGIARDAGTTLVLVLGSGVGDIFRRNALNLGLEVLECPAAAEDARDGHRFRFDPATRRLVNETLGRSYHPKPLTAREAELRRSGGILAAGRREFLASVESKPIIEWPGPAERARLTVTEQILWAHRVDRRAAVSVGESILVTADLLPASDGTAPFAIHTFREITGGAIHPRQAAIANDHFVFTGREADDRQTEISRRFAEAEGLRAPWFATPGDGIFHFYFPEQGLVWPGAVIPGADSHSRAYGAYGALGVGIGSSALGFGWATGSVLLTPPPARRVVLTGQIPPWSSGKDVVLALIAKWNGAAAGASVEFIDERGALPITWRNTICNMMAEAEAWNGLFPFDEVTAGFYADRGSADLPYPPVASGAAARFAAEEVFDLAAVEPLVALPSAPGNAHPATEVAEGRLGFDRAYIGSCTNGSYDDLLAAAQVVRAARERGHDRTREKFVIFPGSGGVRKAIEEAEPRLGGEPVAAVLRSVGGEIRASWCGPCFGQGEDALRPGMRAITSFNRNWENRMGRGGEGYLASPAVVAASALLGYIAPPSELGLRWDPERFGG